MTRKVTFLIVVSLILSTVALAQAATPASSSPAAASAAPNGPMPTKIGVINIQGAILSTNEGRRDFEALTKKFEPKQLELKTLSDEVENLKKQLNAQQDKLNEDERVNRVRTIEQKQKSFQRILEDAQSEFQTQQSEVAGRILSKMGTVLENYAKTNGLAVIIDSSNQASPVLFAAEQVNITPAIIAAYNVQSGVAAPAVSSTPSAPRAPSAPRSTTTPAAKKPAPTGTTPR